MITEIVGKRACGKTLLAVKYAQDALAEGKSVWANIRIAGCQFYCHWTEIPAYGVDLVIVDAADMWLHDLREGWTGQSVLSYLAMADLVLVYSLPQWIDESVHRLANHRKTPSMDGDRLLIDGESIDAVPLYGLYSTRLDLMPIWATAARKAWAESS